MRVRIPLLLNNIIITGITGITGSLKVEQLFYT